MLCLNSTKHHNLVILPKVRYCFAVWILFYRLSVNEPQKERIHSILTRSTDLLYTFILLETIRANWQKFVGQSAIKSVIACCFPAVSIDTSRNRQGQDVPKPQEPLCPPVQLRRDEYNEGERNTAWNKREKKGGGKDTGGFCEKIASVAQSFKGEEEFSGVSSQEETLVETRRP